MKEETKAPEPQTSEGLDWRPKRSSGRQGLSEGGLAFDEAGGKLFFAPAYGADVESDPVQASR